MTMAESPPLRLQRHPENPLMTPDPASKWESLNVFNCAVHYHDELFHMLYRAQGTDFISRIGYAVSSDGIHFNRLENPVVTPMDEWEQWGVEDPRVTELPNEHRFIMAYTAYSPLGITPMFAESTNLIKWHRIGPMMTGEDNKDHVLFPRKINGRYASFHRRVPSIWIAYSDDLKNWTDHAVVMQPRVDNWDRTRIGAGGVPIETDEGWLIIYHAYDDAHTYRLGVALLDLENPEEVVARPANHILEPREVWEVRGDVPHVVFTCANPVVDGTVYVYYGGADHVIALATAPLADLIDFALKAKA